MILESENFVLSFTSWGFDPTNPYSEMADHDYLEVFFQVGRFVTCWQWYFFPVSRWSLEDCSIKLYRRWLKVDLPTLWFRANVTIFPKPSKNA